MTTSNLGQIVELTNGSTPIGENLPPSHTTRAPARLYSVNQEAYLVIPINRKTEPQAHEGYLLCDPLTGLVAYPSFETLLVAELPRLARVGLHLAIGDVDNLRDYVIAENTADPDLFGHLAGNNCMRLVGKAVQGWANFVSTTWPFLVCATFGGDEVIIAGSGLPYKQFLNEIVLLAKQIAVAAPRPCSFAVSTNVTQMQLNRQDSPSFYRRYLSQIDRQLFEQKARTATNRSASGFVLDLGDLNAGNSQ